MSTELAPINVLQVATPSAPSVNSLLYPKSDGRWYTQSPSQAEVPVSHISTRMTSDQATTAAAGSPDALTPLNLPVPGAGTWSFNWLLFWKSQGVGGTAHSGLGYKVNGPSNTNYEATANLQTDTQTTASSFWSNKSLILLDGSTGSGQASSADVVGQNKTLLLRIEGSFTSSASGTLALTIYTTLDTVGSTTSGTTTILTNSFGMLMRGA
jgi:hypothetical protein